MLFLVIALLGTQVILVSGGIYYGNKAIRAVRQTQRVLSELFIPKNEGEASAVGQAASQYIEFISEQIGVKTQAAIRGSIGGSMKGINAALEQEATSDNPNLAIMQALPKSLKKNPVAMIGLQKIMEKVMNNSMNNQNTGNNGHVSPVKFDKF